MKVTFTRTFDVNPEDIVSLSEADDDDFSGQWIVASTVEFLIGNGPTIGQNVCIKDRYKNRSSRTISADRIDHVF